MYSAVSLPFSNDFSCFPGLPGLLLYAGSFVLNAVIRHPAGCSGIFVYLIDHFAVLDGIVLALPSVVS